MHLKAVFGTGMCICAIPEMNWKWKGDETTLLKEKKNSKYLFTQNLYKSIKMYVNNDSKNFIRFSRVDKILILPVFYIFFL